LGDFVDKITFDKPVAIADVHCGSGKSMTDGIVEK